MKYVIQISIIIGISFIGELLHEILPFLVPGSVYGMLLLFILLLTGVVKEKQIQESADFLISIMPLFFIPPAVALMTSFDAIRGNIIKILSICVVSTIVTIVITGKIAQWLVRKKIQRREKHHE